MWETKVSTMVCLSTVESEFVVVVHDVDVKSALWLVNLTVTLCNVPTPPITMFEDNQTCLKMTVNPVVSSRNRHFVVCMWGVSKDKLLYYFQTSIRIKVTVCNRSRVDWAPYLR